MGTPVPETVAPALSLAGWLLEQIAADEAVVARIDRPDDAEPSVLWPAMYDRAMGYNGSVWITPARVLAECAAKRRIVEHERLRVVGSPKHYIRRAVYDAISARLDTPSLRLLASVYADRPGYREEWAPRG